VPVYHNKHFILFALRKDRTVVWSDSLRSHYKQMRVNLFEKFKYWLGKEPAAAKRGVGGEVVSQQQAPWAVTTAGSSF
jgi:hypothetical protein